MASRTDIEDLLHCMICFELYRVPKMMYCGHTFCQECLEGYYKTYQLQRKAVPGKLPCPTCRELTTLNGSVSALPNDFKVKKIEEMFRTVNLKDRKGNKKNCDTCRAKKKNAVAEKYCSDCEMSFCSNCSKKHNANPIFKSHLLGNNDSVQEESVLCKVHNQEEVKYLCKTCQTLICTLCVINQHDNHDLQDLDTVFKMQKEHIKNLKSTLDSKLSLLREKGSQLETLRLMNLKSCQLAEIDIKNKVIVLKKTLALEEEKLLNELNQRKEILSKKSLAELDSVNYMIARGYSLQDFASNMKKDSMCLLALQGELVQRMKTMAELDTILPDLPTHTIISFLPARNELKVGRIDEIEGTSHELKAHSSIRNGNDLKPLKALLSDIHTFDTKHKLLFCLNRKGRGRGELSDPLDVACLPNDEILVSEYGNRRIQIFDTVGKSLGVIGNEQINPQGIAVTCRGNIIVSDAKNKRMEVFTQTGNSLAKWGLGKFVGPCGIAISPNGNVIVSDIGEHSISVFQGEQKRLHRFGYYGSGSDTFNNPLYVACGPNDEIIVSDSDNHTIKIFDSKGKFLRSIGQEGCLDGQFRFPRGVAVNEDGNIIVVDRNNDRISLFTLNGGFIKHILTKEDGIRDPYGVAVSSARNLIITESGSDRAALKLYQLLK